jgi:succinate-acetate transporter protein
MDAAVLILIIQFLSIVLLLVLLAVSIKLYFVLRDIGNVTHRLDILTDIAGWLGFFKKISKK